MFPSILLLLLLPLSLAGETAGTTLAARDYESDARASNAAGKTCIMYRKRIPSSSDQPAYDDTRRQDSVDECKKKCNPPDDGKYHSYGCYLAPGNAQIEWENGPEPGVQWTLGQCTCDNAILDSLAKTFIESLPALAELACDIFVATLSGLVDFAIDTTIDTVQQAVDQVDKLGPINDNHKDIIKGAVQIKQAADNDLNKAKDCFGKWMASKMCPQGALSQDQTDEIFGTVNQVYTIAIAAATLPEGGIEAFALEDLPKLEGEGDALAELSSLDAPAKDPVKPIKGKGDEEPPPKPTEVETAKPNETVEPTEKPTATEERPTTTEEKPTETETPRESRKQTTSEPNQEKSTEPNKSTTQAKSTETEKSTKSERTSESTARSTDSSHTSTKTSSTESDRSTQSSQTSTKSSAQSSQTSSAQSSQTSSTQSSQTSSAQSSRTSSTQSSQSSGSSSHSSSSSSSSACSTVAKRGANGKTASGCDDRTTITSVVKSLPSESTTTKTCTGSVLEQACAHYHSAIKNGAPNVFTCEDNHAGLPLSGFGPHIWSQQHSDSTWSLFTKSAYDFASGSPHQQLGIAPDCQADVWPPAYFQTPQSFIHLRSLLSSLSTTSQPAWGQRIRLLPSAQSSGAYQLWDNFCQDNDGGDGNAQRDGDESSNDRNTAALNEKLVDVEKATKSSTENVESGKTTITEFYNELPFTRAVFEIAFDDENYLEQNDWLLRDNPCWPQDIVPEDPGFVLFTNDSWYASNGAAQSMTGLYNKPPDATRLASAQQVRPDVKPPSAKRGISDDSLKLIVEDGKLLIRDTYLNITRSLTSDELHRIDISSCQDRKCAQDATYDEDGDVFIPGSLSSTPSSNTAVPTPNREMRVAAASTRDAALVAASTGQF